MTKEQLARISELTAIARERELTEQEQKERQQLRQMYLKSIKDSLRGQLDNIEIVD